MRVWNEKVCWVKRLSDLKRKGATLVTFDWPNKPIGSYQKDVKN